MLIRAGSISENVCHREVSNLAKFHAFIKKRTILVVSSWTKFGHIALPRHKVLHLVVWHLVYLDVWTT